VNFSEKVMDPVKLHNMAEQKCKKYGCAVAVGL